jgi:hypothetical protein
MGTLQTGHKKAARSAAFQNLAPPAEAKLCVHMTSESEVNVTLENAQNSSYDIVPLEIEID